MKHIYKKGNDHTLILLHGTGGNEYDLIPIAERIQPEASILSIRGNVLEQGMPRFFKRIAMGVFDMESLKEETKNLYEFIVKASKDYYFDLKKTTLLGYSNGANIAISMLYTYDNPVQKAFLLRPMVPTDVILSKTLSEVEVVILSGKQDPIVSNDHPTRLEKQFKALNAKTSLYVLNTGHNLTQEDLSILVKYTN
ncbi:alpha/beta hydrolase [Acholeplasma vituli]|uniref:Alpha/beta hydrolase n=1 Tax=Paracholeplasma vituli TaxID=69473 RepID=A0ABT2PX16_9MOLU|nr:alpha/beta hydrolase [Paracholeplasma vituli]MCU0104986.1 alpha/beta hydrolase [Paracholeplasma vituli]